jgi:hypothetical protein
VNEETLAHLGLLRQKIVVERYFYFLIVGFTIGFTGLKVTFVELEKLKDHYNDVRAHS